MTISTSEIRTGISRLEQDILSLSQEIVKTHDRINRLDREIRDIRKERALGIIEQKVKPWKILAKERTLYQDKKKHDELVKLEKKYRSDLEHKKRDAMTLHRLANQAERGDEHAFYLAQSVLAHR